MPAHTIQVGEKLGRDIPVMPKRLAIEWCRDIPAGCRQLAERRTRDMLLHYGRNITSMNIETLVVSCYLQGVEDCFVYHDKRATNAMTPNDKSEERGDKAT